MWKITRKHIFDNLLLFNQKTKRNIAIQGELIGEGIQKNKDHLKGQDFYCFDIWDIDKQRYLTRIERKEIIKFLNIKEVPFIENIKIFKILKKLDDFLQYAEGKSLNSLRREGVVLESNKLINNRTISFKIIANSYLLKFKE